MSARIASLVGVLLLVVAGPGETREPTSLSAGGDATRGRLVFAQCRTCHYPEPLMGHNNGPNLHRIFGRVAGKQPGFGDYSQTFREATFVWTPRLMYAWLENPMAMFPDSTMMSLGVPDPQQRADLIAYLERASGGEHPQGQGPSVSESSPVSTPDDYRAAVAE
jgi:cytochrome c